MDNKPELVNSEKLAVWIYDQSESERIRVIDPLSSEENLNAQFGKFTIVKQSIQGLDKIEYQSVDTVCKGKSLVKVTIDKKEAPFLMEYCYRNFIDYASVYPNDNNNLKFAQGDKNIWLKITKSYTSSLIMNDPADELRKINEK